MSGITPMPRRGLERWAGLGAIAYVVLLIGGIVLASVNQPDSGGAPGKIVSYYGDSGHRDRIAIGWLIGLVGVFFFIWFVGALRQLLQRIDSDGLLATVATVGGAIYAALTITAGALDMAIKTMSDDTYRHQVYPGLIHAADDAGYIIHSAGGAGLGALIIAATVAARRAALIPSWAGWISAIVGILAVFSVFFFPQPLIAIWLLVAGWLVFRAAPAAPAHS
jgi:hypothetical protein